MSSVATFWVSASIEGMKDRLRNLIVSLLSGSMSYDDFRLCFVMLSGGPLSADEMEMYVRADAIADELSQNMLSKSLRKRLLNIVSTPPPVLVWPPVQIAANGFHSASRCPSAASS